GMSDDRPHHITKRRLYDLLLVPSDDTGTPKRLRLAPWQMIAAVAGSIGFIIAAVLVLLVYTPLGPLVPIPNPELENRYNHELLSLNQRMSDVMQQLIELRTYNVKLRQALGENVALADSGVVVSMETRRPAPDNDDSSEQRQRASQTIAQEGLRTSMKLVAERIEGEDPRKVDFPVILPTEGYITRTYDPNRRHFGLDVAGKTGTPVNAAAEGYVIFAGWTNEDGYLIILSHAGGFLTFYKHNQTLLKSANSFAKRGEPIALMGNSGVTSSGPHLHFEVWKDGVPVDPASYIINLSF
ncbi:MAG: M23 family metallopeptidase, partial [Bacteroidota bacterium]